jgi:alpha-galactosidase
VLREDFSGNQYWDALQDVVSWWEEVKGLTYLKAPLAARKPLYSFWYSFHQDVNEKSVEETLQMILGLLNANETLN